MLESVKNSASDVVSVVDLRGRLDSTTARDFEVFFDEMTRTGKRAFVLGVRDLEFVSSAGMAVLVRFLRSVEERQGVIVLVNPHAELRLLLQFFQLDKRLVVKESMEEAKAYAVTVLPGESSLEIRRGEDVHSRNSAGHGNPASGHVRPPQSADMQRLGENTTWPRPIFDEPARSPAGTLPPASAASAWARTSTESAMRDPRSSGLVEVDARPSSGMSGPTAPAPGRFNAADMEFREPVFIECEQCRSQMRAYRPGQHMCPTCRIVFRVRRDGTASFQEKLEP